MLFCKYSKVLYETEIGEHGEMKLVFAVALLTISYIADGSIVNSNPTAFEGDIGLDPYTRSVINGNLSPSEAFKGIIGRQWPNAIIPYEYDRYFDQGRRTLMANAMAEYHKKTCIKFVPRQNHRDYILMVNQNACWSIIGRGGGQQLLKMGNHCLDSGTAIHELMHAVGFYHEQSREDRDSYVNIFWNNIQNGESYNFQKYRSNYHGQPYDLNSVMHYRNWEFSANGRNTIESKVNPSLRLGNADFSATDLKAIASMYNCAGGNGGPQPPVCNDNDTRCAYWASTGECNKNPNWMKVNCKKSCNTCS